MSLINETDHPKKHQTTGDTGGFSGTAALDEPDQGAAVALEIFAHAIQPVDLRGFDQPLRGESSFTRGVATSPSIASSRSPDAVSSRAAYARTVSSM